MKDGWNGFSVLHTAASRVGALDIGFVPGEGGLRAAEMAAFGTLDVLFLLGADEIDVARRRLRRLHRHPWRPRRAPRRRHPAGRRLSGKIRHSMSIPKAACRWPSARTFPPGDAREDWAIIRALSDHLGKRLPYDLLAQLRRTIFSAHPHLARIDSIAPGNADDIRKLASLGGTPDKAPFRRAIADFYLTNPIARASAVMAECSALASWRAALTAAE